jgi:hypothetical protein
MKYLSFFSHYLAIIYRNIQKNNKAITKLIFLFISQFVVIKSLRSPQYLHQSHPQDTCLSV